jgi:4-hydroxy-tetrahydrodipicolinate synthase
MKSQFITPAVTVFDALGRPDREQNERLYDHLSTGGVSGMAVLGSAGEFFTMSMETSKRVVDIATARRRDGFRLFVGASRMDPAESVELANYAADKGADGVMIISPYYFPLDDDGIHAYYAAIAPKVGCPIFLYNFPDRTGYSISPKLALRLATEFRNITGFKDTIPDTTHTCDLIGTVKAELPHFEVFSGYDNNFAHNVLAGGSGCIGGLSNLIPEVFARWIAAFAAEDVTKIAAEQKFIDRMMAIYSIGSPFFTVIKKGLVLRGVIDDDASSITFPRVDDRQTAEIRALLDAMAIPAVASAGAR